MTTKSQHGFGHVLAATMLAIGIAGVAWIGSSCPGRGASPGTATLTGAVVDGTSIETAIDQIVIRRCERPCPDVALDEVTHDSCARRLRTGLAVELDPATACPHGVLREALDACLAAIDQERCTNASSAPMSLVACRPSTLCPSEATASVARP